MVVFFIIVSLIFNVIALLAVILLFLRQNKLLLVEKQQKEAMEEMELLINSYLLEMKDENERFIQRVKGIQSEKQEHSIEPSSSTDDMKLDSDIKKTEKMQESILEAEKKEPIDIDSDSFELAAKLEKTVSMQAVKAYQQQMQKKRETLKPSVGAENKEQGKSIIEMKKAFSQVEKEKTRQSDALIQDSLLTQVMIMKREGLTEQEMAQKLKKGMTEIELLLKFRENQRE